MGLKTVLLVSFCSLFNAATVLNVPWDGRFQGLTVSTISDQYLTHILDERQSPSYSRQYFISSLNDPRSKVFNNDTGVFRFKVNENAIFKQQVAFRRSEVAQLLSCSSGSEDSSGCWLRASFRFPHEFVHQRKWEIVFEENQHFQIRIDATLSTPQFFCALVQGKYTVTNWNPVFQIKKWFNVAFYFSKSTISFYASEDNQPLQQYTTANSTAINLQNIEYHVGLLTHSNDMTTPIHLSGDEVIDLSGVSADVNIPTTELVKDKASLNSNLANSSTPSTAGNTSKAPASSSSPTGTSSTVSNSAGCAATLPHTATVLSLGVLLLTTWIL